MGSVGCIGCASGSRDGRARSVIGDRGGGGTAGWAGEDCARDEEQGVSASRERRRACAKQRTVAILRAWLCMLRRRPSASAAVTGPRRSSVTPPACGSVQPVTRRQSATSSMRACGRMWKAKTLPAASTRSPRPA
ncbi:MAG: hypothetical protein MO847_03880 [Candidatus Protistobacter heckmanni]|nr:hypothetical protein [Candidatus Protistobacter heckmanni]